VCIFIVRDCTYTAAYTQANSIEENATISSKQLQNMSRTVAQIETEIQAIKDANHNWITRADIIALITELMKEKNLLSGK